MNADHLTHTDDKPRSALPMPLTFITNLNYSNKSLLWLPSSVCHSLRASWVERRSKGDSEMRSAWPGLAVASALIMELAGCGGSGTPPPPPGPTIITVTFTNATPQAAAVQIGSGGFTAASIQGGKLSLTVPAGSTTYAIAYVCPPFANVVSTESNEFVIEATIQDTTSYTISCAAVPAMGIATGSVDASAIPGTTSIAIGGRGIGFSFPSNQASFNVNLPTGANDIAALALDGSNNVLAVKIVRSQTVPGAVNGGSTIVLGPSDETTLQSVTVNNTPVGFIPAEQFVEYITPNGTALGLGLSSAPQYRAVPSAAGQPGDMYFIDSSTDDTATRDLVVGVNLTMSSANPLTINLPPVWSFSGPAPTAFPTFTFNYSGFNIAANLSYQAIIQWQPTPSTLTGITVTATASFQNNATTLRIPNLTSLPGFFAPAPTGTLIDWNATIFNGDQSLALVTEMPAGSGPFVETRGTYTEP